jgi:predicted metal-dependent phosphoesterase TrpH
MATAAQVVDYAEHATDLDVIAVTDHEDIEGGLLAREHALQMGYTIEVVPGAEITTVQGHVLALFIEETPPSFRPIEQTIETIHEMGGLAIIPHPLSWLTRSVSERTLRRLTLSRGEACWPDGIELHNPSPAGRKTAARAEMLNARLLDLPGVGGSDAHHLPHLGAGWTVFQGRSAEDLRQSLCCGTVHGHMTDYPSIRETGLVQVLAGLGWGYTATPRKMIKKAVGR